MSAQQEKGHDLLEAEFPVPKDHKWDNSKTLRTINHDTLMTGLMQAETALLGAGWGKCSLAVDHKAGQTSYYSATLLALKIASLSGS